MPQFPNADQPKQRVYDDVEGDQKYESNERKQRHHLVGFDCPVQVVDTAVHQHGLQRPPGTLRKNDDDVQRAINVEHQLNDVVY